MLPSWLVLATSFIYLCLLFAIAYYGDRRADRGRSIIASPTIYALSIGVYCTAWTFYGSVGRAATSGVGFLPVYLGPTLMFAFGWVVLRKIIRISKVHHVTSIADLISSRYGKSHLLGGLVTIIAVIGIMPYISLQLKAVSSSFSVLQLYPNVTTPDISANVSIFGDTAFWVAILMALFSILFGTRHIDATEHHEGMVAAIAFEGVVKLLAFLAVGLFVTFGVYDGFGDVFGKAANVPEISTLLTLDIAGADWLPLTFLSMMAIICLPRQFQIVVVENVDESHLAKAIWLLPLYLLLINLFVLPIALGGLLMFPEGFVDADMYVLALPMAVHQPGIALLAFIGGLSAATGMVIVATVALSTMICNDLVMPLLLRFARLHLSERKDLSRLLLDIRRTAIALIMVLGYFYFHFIGESYALVAIGLVSFAAAAQFAPAIMGGIYWKGATRRGALAGISAGFLVWGYTLVLPSFSRSGWLPDSFVTAGPLGIEFLKPYALFGLDGLTHIAHSLFWSMLANIGCYVGVSLFSTQSTIERIQATLFVEVFRQSNSGTSATAWYGSVTTNELRNLTERFLGVEKTREALREYARLRNRPIEPEANADGELIQFVERRLAGVIGAASARVMIASTVKGEGVGLEAIMQILDETSQVLEYSRQL
ncbi:MAG: sodium:solute symporter, partial [Rhodospirillales bacterium]|nr:sodium:solute symporter [Rhodospirillales bacterium]